MEGDFIIKPTIRSMAKDLNLSSATVSKALSGRPEINSDTRARVVNHASEVGYLKGATGNGWKNGNGRKRFGIVTVKSEVSESTYNTSSGNNHDSVNNHNSLVNNHSSLMYDVIMGFRDYAEITGHDVIMLATDISSQATESFDRFASYHQLDGVFIAGLKTTDIYYRQLSNTIIPVVLMDMIAESPSTGSVGTDSILGGELAISLLVKKGHRRIGFVNGHKEAYISKERLAGYVAGIQNFDIKYDPDLYYIGDFSQESGGHAADYFAKTDATAIYFASDKMAHGAIRRFLEVGYNLPKDMSIIGFDNMSIGQGCIPSITTVAQDPVGLGENACAVLCGIIQKSPIRHVRLAPYLIERESVAELL